MATIRMTFESSALGMYFEFLNHFYKLHQDNTIIYTTLTEKV
jgi:hypothetical protein